MARQYSPDERRRAVELGREVGPTEAARRLGIPEGSVKGWMARAAHPSPEPVPATLDLVPEALRPAVMAAGTAAVTAGTAADNDPDAETKARLERFRIVNRIATEAARAAREKKREQLRDLLLDKAIEALELTDKPHVDFKGKDADRVTYPRAPASAFQNYATSAAILLDKYRLEVGESTSNSEVMIRERVEIIARKMGVDPDEVLEETRRLLAEGPRQEDDEK